jgi:hypothetical protein
LGDKNYAFINKRFTQPAEIINLAIIGNPKPPPGTATRIRRHRLIGTWVRIDDGQPAVCQTDTAVV